MPVWVPRAGRRDEEAKDEETAADPSRLSIRAFRLFSMTESKNIGFCIDFGAGFRPAGLESDTLATGRRIRLAFLPVLLSRSTRNQFHIEFCDTSRDKE